MSDPLNNLIANLLNSNPSLTELATDFENVSNALESYPDLPLPFKVDLIDFKTNNTKGTGLISTLFSGKLPPPNLTALAKAIALEIEGSDLWLLTTFIQYLITLAHGGTVPLNDLEEAALSLSYASTPKFHSAFLLDLKDFAIFREKGYGLIATLLKTQLENPGYYIPLALAIVAEWKNTSSDLIQHFLSLLITIKSETFSVHDLQNLSDVSLALAYLCPSDLPQVLTLDLQDYLSSFTTEKGEGNLSKLQSSESSPEERPILAKKILDEYLNQ